MLAFDALVVLSTNIRQGLTGAAHPMVSQACLIKFQVTSQTGLLRLVCVSWAVDPCQVSDLVHLAWPWQSTAAPHIGVLMAEITDAAALQEHEPAQMHALNYPLQMRCPRKMHKRA